MGKDVKKESLLSEAERLEANEAKQEKIFGLDVSFESRPPKTPVNKRQMLAQTVLAGLALPAGMFYKKYSQLCVLDNFCRTPISFITNPKAQQLTLAISGGGGFSGSATALGVFAATSLSQTYQELPSRLAKLGLSVYAVFFVLSQITQITLGTLGSIDKDEKITDPDNMLLLLFPAMAVIPTSLYTVSITFPSLFKKLQKLCKPREDRHEQDSPEKLKFYQHQLDDWRRRLQNKLEYAKSHIPELKNAIKTDTLLNALYLHEEASCNVVYLPSDVLPESKCNRNTRLVGKSVGFITGSAFAASIIWNVYTQLNRFTLLRPMPIRISLTAMFGAMSVPAFLKLPMEYFGGTSSMLNHLYPIRAGFVAGLITLLQYPSYSAVVMLWEKLLQASPYIKNPLMILAMVGVIAYHAKSLIELMALGGRKLVRDPDARYLLEIERIINQLSALSLEQFIEGVEKLSHRQREDLGLIGYNFTLSANLYQQKVSDVREEEKFKQLHIKSIELVTLSGKRKDSEYREPPARQSWCARLFSRFLSQDDGISSQPPSPVLRAQHGANRSESPGLI